MCATETARGGIQMLLACTLFTVDKMLYVTSLHLPARAMSGDPAREVRPLWYPVSTVRRADSTSDRSPSAGMKGRMSGRPCIYSSIYKLDANRGWSAAGHPSPKISSTIDELIFYILYLEKDDMLTSSGSTGKISICRWRLTTGQRQGRTLSARSRQI
jgi:hypothetical protein